ncbi:MAG: hypothetical protein IMZ52_04695 [Actinobacteria bacterium]|nr:hypothetical protein [Actinomycetota bacterium]MBE3114763.1 hypothetical protein [Actinomycetota bacterium]
MLINKHAYICPCCESNPADILGESTNGMISMLCVKCGPIGIRKNQKKTLKIWNDLKLPTELPIKVVENELRKMKDKPVKIGKEMVDTDKRLVRELHLDGRDKERYTGPWLQNRPNKCETCKKKTDELYCTPMGICNWRCNSCQIQLCEAVYSDYETDDDIDKHVSEWPDSYPVRPNGYHHITTKDRPLEVKPKGSRLGTSPIDEKICKYSNDGIFRQKCVDKGSNRCKECAYFYENIKSYEDMPVSKKSYFKSIAPVG